MANRSSRRPCSARRSARSVESVDSSICEQSSEISISWCRAAPMIWVMQWCTARRNSGSRDGSIRPLARARSTSTCASSAVTRNAAATSSGPRSGLSDDTSKVSSTGSSTRRSRSISANLAAAAIVVAGASPSGVSAAASAGRTRNGRPAVAAIRPRRSSGGGAAPNAVAAARFTSEVGSEPSDTKGFSRSIAVASARRAG